MIKLCFLINKREYYNVFIEYIISNLKDYDVYFYFKDNKYYKFENLQIIDDINWVFDNCKYIFSLGYWKLIKNDDIQKVEERGGKIINIHYSYLLKYEGRHTCTHAIQNNEIYHGVSIYYITEKLDNGPIIDSQKIQIDEHDTSYTLMKKCNNLALELFKKNIFNIINNKITISLVKEPNSVQYSFKDIKHQIESKYIVDENRFYDLIRSLTYPNKKEPYIVIKGKKIFLKIEDVLS